MASLGVYSEKKDRVLFLALIFLSLAGILVFFVGKEILNSTATFSYQFNSEYQAVFLDNGQVYFGKITENKSDILTLSSVYYLQIEGGNEQLDLAQENVKVIKLGNEIHGPEDIIYINKSKILLIQELSADSKVLDAIKQN